MDVHKSVAVLVSVATALDLARAQETGSGSDSPTIIYVVVGVVVLLFIVAAIFVWVRSRKRGKDVDHLPVHETPVMTVPPARAPVARGNSNQNHNYHQHASPHVNARDMNNRNRYEHPRPEQQQPPRRPVPPPPQQQKQQRRDDNRAPPPRAGGGATRNNQRPQRANETAARVLTEFQADPALCRRKIPYAALYFTRVLSKGAFGEVWLAQLENRQVAVKRILNEKKNDEKEIECFAAEIKLMASFYHPKIVEFVGVSWSTLQDLCAVTEYMAKGDLYGFLKRKNGQLNWRDHKIYLAEDVADALGYLHSLTPKVIHRDLKSKNILLDDTFRAKLSDFGISRERSLEETMTAGVGTIYWTAPEVLMGKKYTEKADIYSFGIVMSELDTHEVPYSDMRDEQGRKLQGMKIVQQVIKKKQRPTFSPHCPAKVRELAMRCLDGEPDARPDALELLHLIQRIQQKL